MSYVSEVGKEGHGIIRNEISKEKPRVTVVEPRREAIEPNLREGNTAGHHAAGFGSN